MERWTISKADFLLLWGVPTFLLSAPIAIVAWIVNRLTNGEIETLLAVIATAGIVVIATVHAIWMLIWTDVN